MKRIKVVLDFIKFAIAEKIAFFRNSLKLMTNNALFVKPDVLLADVTLLVDKLETDFTAAKSGDHALVAVMNQSELAADEAFRKLALYVDRIANGDAAVILKAGFHISKQPEASKREAFRVEAGPNPREIILLRKAQPGAKSYVWQYCIGPLPTTEQVWIFAGATTKARFVIINLESGSKCWFRVAAVTIEGIGPWSAPVMRVVP
jgi:hypothetical protein